MYYSYSTCTCKSNYLGIRGSCGMFWPAPMVTLRVYVRHMTWYQ